MSEIVPDPKMKEINLFKNDIYGLIRQLESKLNERINKSQSELKDNFEIYAKKINSLIENDKDMVISLVNQKLKLDKIAELESFKNKVDDKMITHEVRINNNLDEISKIKLRYDKIISENLYVSGFIGGSCQFKNLSEYLSYNISEVSKLKIEKDQIKKDIKDLKAKFEGLMKSMISLNENTVQLSKNYTDKKQEEYQILLENNSKELNQKFIENKALICEFHEETKKNEKKYNEEFNKLIDMKNDFIILIDEKILDIKKDNDELNRKIINNKLDLDIHKNKIENINGQINNLNKNTKDLSFKVRNYYCANNKVSNILEKIEKLGKNPTNLDIQKIFQTKNEIMPRYSNNFLSYSISPFKQHGNKQNITKSAIHFKQDLDEIKPIKKNITKSIIQPKKICDKIGINIKNETLDSESSFSDDNIDDKEKNIKNNINKNNYDIMTNKKINSSIKENNFTGINLNENNGNKINDNNINGNNINDNKTNGNNLNENNTNGNNLNNNNTNLNNLNDNNINPNNLNDKIINGNNLNDNNLNSKNLNNNNLNENILNENNINGKILNENNLKEKNLLENNVIKYNNTLPSLSRNIKYEPNLEENKNVNITSNEVNKSIFSKENDKIEKKIKVKKSTIYNLLNNEYENNKIKLNQKKEIIKRRDYEIEQDNQACRLVTLTLPDPLKINAISKRDKIEKNKMKNDVMNTIINSYRAKLFYKAHSPEEKIGINNELLEIPKKLTPAFGRTTYTFYFKKDKINSLNVNKNINSINSNYKKNYKDIRTTLKDDIGQ